MAKRIEIRVDDDLYGEILKHAESQDRTVNWIAGKALVDYCAAATQKVGSPELHSPRAAPQTGKPWSDPTSDPVGDIRRIAEKAGAPRHVDDPRIDSRPEQFVGGKAEPPCSHPKGKWTKHSWGTTCECGERIR